MTPIAYIKYGSVALVAIWLWFTWNDYQGTKQANIELSENYKQQGIKLDAANSETEVANENVRFLGDEYGKLQNETEAWRKRQQAAQRARQKAEKELRAITANLADTYTASSLNRLLCQSFAKASGESWDCEHQQAMPVASASSLAAGSWFIFDQENTNALILNVQAMSNYIAEVEDAAKQ